MTRQKDILDELTKDELLAWLRTKCFIQLPKRSEIIAMRWSKQSDDLLAAFEAENRWSDGIDFAERDRLAVQLNETTCFEERIRLLDLIEPYHQARTDHYKRYEALLAKEKKVDKLYEQIEIERQKELRS